MPRLARSARTPSGAIRLNGTVPPNFDQPAVRSSNSCGPCAGLRALLSPRELPEVEQLWSERISLERHEIAKAIKHIRQKTQQELESIIAERWTIRRIGRQHWTRVNRVHAAQHGYKRCRDLSAGARHCRGINNTVSVLVHRVTGTCSFMRSENRS